MLPDHSTERYDALQFAVSLHEQSFYPGGATAVCETALILFRFLVGPNSLVITAGPVVDQTTGLRTGNPGGNTVKDNEKMPLTITALDAKGQSTAVGDSVTVVSSDTNILTISDRDVDGIFWAIAGVPGSATITADWADSPNGDLPGTLAVDVTAGDATSLAVTAGAPVPQ